MTIQTVAADTFSLENFHSSSFESFSLADRQAGGREDRRGAASARDRAIAKHAVALLLFRIAPLRRFRPGQSGEFGVSAERVEISGQVGRFASRLVGAAVEQPRIAGHRRVGNDGSWIPQMNKLPIARSFGVLARGRDRSGACPKAEGNRARFPKPASPDQTVASSSSVAQRTANDN